MRAGVFQLIDETVIDNLIPKTDFAKIRHQQNAQLNEADEESEFV